MATFQLNSTGIRSGTVILTNPQGATFSYDFTLAVKYVRREIRAMTVTDRTRFFNALYALYSTSEDIGKKKYGRKFNTAEYFAYKHLNGAGTTDCDHWHDGAGILVKHMAFTLEVEQALQAVDPAVSLPYWEYSMDTIMYSIWWESPVFGPDWLGEANPKNSDHKISDGGLWQSIQMPDGSPYTDWSIADTGSLNPFVNGYGLLRSPWNNNPSSFIGRHNQTYGRSQYSSMPSCSTMRDCFQSTSLADLFDCSNGATHGPVHILIGGAWGEGTLFSGSDTDLSFVQNPDKVLFFKVLWRMGFTRCPDTCTKGVPCRCSVPQKYIDEYGAYYILEKTNVYYALEKHLTDADDDLYMKVLRAVEDPGIAGEMFSSGAAYDPSFWPLHGAMERMANLKRILISQGEIENFDETWAFKEYEKSTGAAYLAGVCDWSKVAGPDDLTLPDCTMGVTCFGHNENDLIEFSGFLNENDAYTNIDFWNFMHPWNDDYPYIYDTYDYDYCADIGYNFYEESSALPMPVDGTLPGGSSGGGPPGKLNSRLGNSKTLGSAGSGAQAKSKPTYKGLAPGQSIPKFTKRTLPKGFDVNRATVASLKEVSDQLKKSTGRHKDTDTTKKSSSSVKDDSKKETTETKVKPEATKKSASSRTSKTAATANGDGSKASATKSSTKGGKSSQSKYITVPANKDSKHSKQ